MVMLLVWSVWAEVSTLNGDGAEASMETGYRAFPGTFQGKGMLGAGAPLQIF